ncbi:prephenate dehydratase [Methanobrevibacter sp. AbM4]|uniref:prephenate dehydratase n=1 Tax=Methanobrevibacter sp. AbM4 TaxID=224719 RepID=UPI00064FA353|nr:prephenate dehydratase [Methanobrevibacter sp. AbM4]
MSHIAFLGPEGTFTHQAASILKDKLYDDSTELVYFDTINDVMDAVITSKCVKGVVPIENSIEGPVNVTLDALVHEYDLMIEGEIVLPINHNLMAPKGLKLSDISDVYSHPQALAQCHNYILNNSFRVHSTSSTAAACKNIVNLKNSASIGTVKAAKLYGLNILDENIQDVDNNETRFVVLSKHDSRPTGNDKTSIVFSLHDDRPGGLYGILGIFAEFSINLSKIESRPSKQGLNKYVFFINFEGHRQDEDIGKILKLIGENTSFFKVLGSYHLIQ